MERGGYRARDGINAFDEVVETRDLMQITFGPES